MYGKSYILKNAAGEYIARDYFSAYVCRDYIGNLSPVYGGRVTASYALTFDTPEEAEFYLKRNEWAADFAPWEVIEYDNCANTICVGKWANK